MQIFALIQARLSSKRFPGKVLHEVGGRPLLSYLLERLSHSKQIHKIIVATSVEPEDDRIELFCEENVIPCFRGPLDAVADRFAQCLKVFPCDAFVRVSADSPLLDPALVDQAISLFKNETFDMVSNVVRRTYPKGQSVEVLSTKFYLKHLGEMGDQNCQEHVTSYFYRTPERFRIGSFESLNSEYGKRNLAVDTEEDWQQFVRIVTTKGLHWPTMSWEECLKMSSIS